jgi:hypothetical protein
VTVHVLPEAENEANEAAAWYEDRQSLLGARFLAEVETALAVVRQNAASLPRAEHYSGNFDVRRLSLRRFPYTLIVYCESDIAIVVAVAHTRRRPLYWLNRLN